MRRPAWHVPCVRNGMDQAIRFLRTPNPAPTTVFAVVGERRDDPNHLLLLGEDGRLYDFPLPEGLPLPVEPDETWVVDATVAIAQEVAVESHVARW